MLKRMVFANPLIWILSLANFFVYIVRFSVLDWGPSLLKQSKGISLEMAGWLVALFEIAGIIGMLVAGWATDRYLKGRAHRTCVICMGGAALFIFLFWELPLGSPIWLRRVLYLRPPGSDRYRRRKPSYKKLRCYRFRIHRTVRLRKYSGLWCRSGICRRTLRMGLGIHHHDHNGHNRYVYLLADVAC